jgi:hypothetical protein
MYLVDGLRRAILIAILGPSCRNVIQNKGAGGDELRLVDDPYSCGDRINCDLDKS